MPIDREHAFGIGSTVRLGRKPPKREISERRRRLIQQIRKAIREEEIEEVVASFKAGCDAHESVRVGPAAWCVNQGNRESITLGANVICRGLLRLENFRPARLSIAEDVYIGDDTIISCAEEIEIGRLTLIAHGVQIFDNDSHPLDPAEREKDYLTLLGKISGPRPAIGCARVTIGSRVWIGMGSMVLKGSIIGDGSVIAAGSIVTGEIPPYSVAAGVPARVISRVSPEGSVIAQSTDS